MATALVVQKYGGSSLGTPERIREVARKIAERACEDARIIVTVSAMGRTTDDLVRLAYQITPDPTQREMDMLLTVGERISMALLSMALNSIGCPTISFTGSQSGIVTSIRHTRALIHEIRADRIRKALSEGRVVIVAGFQGVSVDREITTLGRGGSDTTAVALAAALGASRCEIYSDVPGVFTADPRIVPGARRLPAISYEEMLELAARGAKVLHYRAADLARRYRVALHLLSSFSDEDGTVVTEGVTMESPRAKSITSNANVAHVRVRGPSGTAAGSDIRSRLLRHLSETDVQVFGYDRRSSGREEILDLVVAREDLEGLRRLIGPEAPVEVEVSEEVATVSVVGTGFACTAHALLQIEETLDRLGVSRGFVFSSALSATVLVPLPERERVVEALHRSFFPDS